jgi:uncharacterized membrane protein
MQKFAKNDVKRLKVMGWALISIAAVISLTAFLIPTSEMNFWISAKGKEGFYALSGLFAFFGLYCLGATWRRQHFI